MDQPVSSKLQVHIQRPGETVWKGEAEWISSANSQGPFDILPLHSNFITIIQNSPIKIKTRDEVKEFTYPGCILYTNKNIVKIFINL